MSNTRPILTALVLVAAVLYQYRLLSSSHPDTPLSRLANFNFSKWGSASISIFRSNSRFAPRDDYPSDVVNLTRKLVSFGMHEPYDYISNWLSKHNLSVALHPMPDSTNGKRANVLAVVPGTNLRDVRVLLFTHMDVVSGGPPIELSGDDGYLYGRGTTDARGILASMMVALYNMNNSNSAVAFLAVTGEETTHDGIKSVATWDETLPDDIILVNGEPTEGRIATSQKGILKFTVEAKGKAAHSGYPSLGNSAIGTLIDFLSEMQSTDWNANLGIDLDLETDKDIDAGNTMNIGQISGGTAPNVVAANARAVIAFRCVSPPNTLLLRVRDIANNYSGIGISNVLTASPMEFYVPPKAAEKYGTYQANYNTDVPSYPQKYKHAVLFGGGSIHVAHTANERAEIKALQEMSQQFEYITRELLGEEEEKS